MDFTAAEADRWKVSYLIAQSTSEKNAVAEIEPPRDDRDLILSWAGSKQPIIFQDDKFAVAPPLPLKKKKKTK